MKSEMKPETSIVIDSGTASPVELGAVRNAALKYLKQSIKKREVIFVAQDVLIGKLFCDGGGNYLDYAGTLFRALFVSQKGEEAQPRILVLKDAEHKVSLDSNSFNMHNCLQMPDGTIVHTGTSLSVAMGLRDIEFPAIN